MKRFLLSICIIMAILSPLRSQEQPDETQKKPDPEVVQFSGVVVNDNLQPVPYTNIIIKNTRRGTVSDYYGYFSFVALRNDTLQFSAMGYKDNTFIIPDTISQKRYSLIHVMNADTIMLAPTVIYPWPTEEEFKKAFIALDIPDDDLEIARKNLAKQEMKERAINYKMDGSMNYTNYVQDQTSKLYYAGQSQPISLLNPFAWAQFIKAWKEGKFKKDKD